MSSTKRVSLDVMHSKPGIYLIYARWCTGLLEIDEQGRCWQLDIETFERACELSRGGWITGSIDMIVGPLFRSSSHDPAKTEH